MNNEKKKNQSSPFIISTSCAKDSDTVNSYDYFMVFITKITSQSARIVSNTKLKFGQVVACALEVPGSLVTVLNFAKVIRAQKTSSGLGDLYIAEVRFFDVNRAVSQSQVVSFNKVKTLLMNYGDYFRNIPWASVKPIKCLSNNANFGQ